MTCRQLRRRSRRARRRFAGWFAEVWSLWRNVRGTHLSAALAYYALVSLFPLFGIVLAVMGELLGEDQARAELVAHAQDLLGEHGARPISQFLLEIRLFRTTVIGTTTTLVLLLWGAVLVFSHLKKSLNIIWGVAPRRHPVTHFIVERAAALALVVAVVVLILAAHALTAAFSALGRAAPELLPGPKRLVQIVDFAASFLIAGGLAAFAYKVLPDVRVPWRDALVGALWAALLLTASKTALAAYLSHFDVATVYGATVSLTIVMLAAFVYAQIVLIGAILARVSGLRRAKLQDRP